MNLKKLFQFDNRPNNGYYLYGWGFWSVAVVLSLSHVFKYELTSVHSVSFAISGLILMYIGMKIGEMTDD